MSQHFEFKGYVGTIKPNMEFGNLHGKLAFIRDLVTYEAETLPELEKEFKVSVDDYLASCAEVGKKPDVPCKGSFNIRPGKELHLKAALASGDKSLNAWVTEAIAEKLEKQSV